MLLVHATASAPLRLKVQQKQFVPSLVRPLYHHTSSPSCSVSVCHIVNSLHLYCSQIPQLPLSRSPLLMPMMPPLRPLPPVPHAALGPPRGIHSGHHGWVQSYVYHQNLIRYMSSPKHIKYIVLSVLAFLGFTLVLLAKEAPSSVEAKFEAHKPAYSS